MAPKVCMTKLKKEMKAFLSSPPPHIPAIFVNERNILEWHFLLEGPPDTPYAGGWYIGKLRFPPEYPFKPPAIMMLTPSGRFATGTRLCLSMSDFHPESWNPMWTVSSILTGLLSFMLEDQITTGSLQSTNEEKQELAASSLDYNLDHAQLKAIGSLLKVSQRRHYNRSRLRSSIINHRVIPTEAAEAKDAGNDLFRHGDFTGSLQAYDQSLSVAPKCAAVYCNKAAALAKLQRYEEAIAAAKQALSLNRNYSKARRRMHDSISALKR
ncbi:hypothetical protein WJX79_006834 [Trebouxia sp. C0005]